MRLKKRVLLISDIAPTAEHTAGIVLERIFQFTGELFLYKCIILVDDALPEYSVSSYMGNADIYWTEKPKEDWSKLKSLPKMFIREGEKLASSDATSIAASIRTQISRERPDHMLIVIQGQSSIEIAVNLKDLLIPTTYIHWDIFSWWSMAHNLSEEEYEKRSRQLSEIFESGFHLVPTREFAEFYGKSIDSMTLYPSLYDSQEGAGSKDLKIIKIAFTGQVYAHEAFQNFILALKNLNWEIDGKKIELHIFGKAKIENESNPNIVYRDWVHYLSMPKLLSDFSFAFLPYPSGGILDDVSRTSFPSKLSVYISSGLEVLYLGPLSSAAAKIIGNAGYALAQDSKIEDITRHIRQLVLEKNNRNAAVEKIYNDYFSKRTFVNTLRSWLLQVDLILEDTEIGYSGLQNPPVPIRTFERLHPHRNASTKYFNFLRSLKFYLNPKNCLLLLKVAARKLVNQILKVF